MPLVFHFVNKPKYWLIGGLIVLVVGTVVMWLISNTVLKPLKVMEISPNPKDRIDLRPEIVLILNREVGANEKDQLTVVTKPELGLEYKIVDKQIRVEFKRQILPDTTFGLAVGLGNQVVFTTRFTTKPIEYLNSQEKADFQTYLDFEYAQGQEKAYQERPWLKDLPIYTDKYVVVYDSEVGKVRVRLIVPSSNAVKQEAINELKKKGVPVDDIFWIE